MYVPICLFMCKVNREKPRVLEKVFILTYGQLHLRCGRNSSCNLKVEMLGKTYENEFPCNKNKTGDEHVTRRPILTQKDTWS